MYNIVQEGGHTSIQYRYSVVCWDAMLLEVTHNHMQYGRLITSTCGIFVHKLYM